MNDQLIQITSYSHETDAGLAQALLKDNEIESFLSDSNVSALYTGMYGLFGGIKLHVKISDQERAIRLLKESGDSNYSTTDDTVHVCPSCGSHRTKYKKFTEFMIFLFTGLLMSQYPPAKRKMECLKCGHIWRN